VTLARQSQSKRSIMRNSANREDASGIPQMNNHLSPRKRQALAEVVPYVIHVYGRKLTCLPVTTMPPSRTGEMDIEGPVVEGTNKTQEGVPQQEVLSKSGRPPPIVLTAATNLMQLQRQFRGFVTGNFEFRSTRSGTRIVTKEVADVSAIKTFLEKKELSFYTFFPKSKKPIKAVIRHLPMNTPAEDISDGLVGLGFDVISAGK
jgi:hypothetical protein